MTVKYHVKPNGEPARCVAEVSCDYGFSVEEHYSTKIEASKAYEESMSSEIFTISRKTSAKHSSKKAVYGVYEFTVPCDSYGLNFREPDVVGVYLQEGEDYEMYYRFEELSDLFEECSAEDVKPGYSLNVEMNTLQYVMSEQIVDEYASEKNPFIRSKFKYDEDEEFGDYDYDSVPIVAIIKNEVFIIDGNHRFAAAKKKGLSAFAAAVVEFSDDMDSFWDVSAEDFNRRFENRVL